MENKSKLIADLSAKKAARYNNPPEEKPIQLNLEIKNEVKAGPAAPAEDVVSVERLREAVIWAEILGKPRSKRRKIR